VNCANLPEGFIESELFGHERGAFTGASSPRIGRFELADGGTIFLDEIGELPMPLQAKLLRVLQEGEFERLGSASVTRVNVRVIAATNRDLEKEMTESRFRSDLFFRLNAFPINIPPLRERKEDIPTLACHFLELTSRKLGRNFSGITKSDIISLKNYPWPGNVRELRHVIERSAILSGESGFRVSLPVRQSLGMPSGDRIIPLKNMERLYIEKALQQTGWKISGPGGTAELLDIKRTTLAARMKALGIEKPWKN
jgi:transcriptional regulator with GAF, ATPase, and Fis domain